MPFQIQQPTRPGIWVQSLWHRASSRGESWHPWLKDKRLHWRHHWVPWEPKGSKRMWGAVVEEASRDLIHSCPEFFHRKSRPTAFWDTQASLSSKGVKGRCALCRASVAMCSVVATMIHHDSQGHSWSTTAFSNNPAGTSLCRWRDNYQKIPEASSYSFHMKITSCIRHEI